jgi:hypothetical protein
MDDVADGLGWVGLSCVIGQTGLAKEKRTVKLKVIRWGPRLTGPVESLLINGSGSFSPTDDVWVFVSQWAACRCVFSSLGHGQGKPSLNRTLLLPASNRLAVVHALKAHLDRVFGNTEVRESSGGKAGIRIVLYLKAPGEGSCPIAA